MTYSFHTGSRCRPAAALLRVAFFIVLHSWFSTTCAAQCISTAARSGTNFTNDNSIGVFSFSNVSNASASDNQYATANALATVFSGNTEYLKITGFGLSVPASALICGVTMTMECRATGITLLASVRDNDIKLVKNGATTGTNQAKANGWPDTETQVTYGGTNSTWGAFLTPQDVNSPQFGVAVSGRINGLLGVLPGIRIDHVSLTVHYSLPNVLPVRITNFKTFLQNSTVTNNWHVATTEPDAVVTLQRSTNGEQWHPVQQYTQPHTGLYQHSETLTAKGVYYYRLQLQAANSTRYSETNHLVFSAGNALRLHPNPAGNRLTIHNVGTTPLHLYNSSGQKVNVPVNISNGVATLNISALPNGLYWLKAGTATQTFLKH